MKTAYAIGHILVLDEDKWAQYCAQVPATVAPWGGELLLRGKKVRVLSGKYPKTDTVVVRFPDIESAHGWFDSPAYQALIPLRDQGASVDLVAFEGSD
ncbi:MAG: DUF1330 domain-containing protein [Halomonadaceae bacterium]|nr:MAG: DUF1330 domain-containing protein [Halomonadaceae bacterium]